MRQSKIIKAKHGLNITTEGIVLYEFIDGDIYKSLNQLQLQNAVKYIKKCNEALKTVPFNKDEIKARNHWDQARSIGFITEEFPKYLPEMNIESEDKRNISEAIRILTENNEKIAALQCQLIHADLGPDNIIFKGDEVISIIDFTPAYGHELYSLCQFIYWTYLWGNQSYHKEEIAEFYRLYSFNNIGDEMEIFDLLLLKAVLYRIIGPFLDMLNKNDIDYDGLTKRFTILKELMNIYDGKKQALLT